MGDNCTDTLNKLIQPSFDVKLKLLSLISENEQRIAKLKDIILFGESAEALSVFSSHGEHFLKEIDRIQHQLAILEPRVESSLQTGKDLAEKIIPDVLQMRSLQTSLSVAERDEAVARYREGAAETDAAKRAKLSVPVRLILEPLEKRFLFNFYGDRITNKPEKPEWYFTEVLTWITINDQWLTWMQDEQLRGAVKTSSSLRKSVFPHVRPHFLVLGPEGTAETATDSADLTIGLLTTPPPFFGHLTDEMLTFEKCLEGLCYHPQALRPADLFTHRLDILQHWIALESDLAHRKLKDLLAKPYAWRVDNKVPQCVGDFVTLVYSISRRAVHLHHKAAKSRVFFFKVQLDLVFTFLEAMTAALPWNTTTSAALEGMEDESRDHLTRWTSILNALHTVVETMQEWTNDQYFVELCEDPESHRLLTCAWDPWMDEEVEVMEFILILYIFAQHLECPKEPGIQQDKVELQKTICEPKNWETNGWKTITRRLSTALMEAKLSEAAKTTAAVRRGMQCPGVFSEKLIALPFIQISELYECRIQENLHQVGQSLFGRLRRLAQTYLSDSKQWSRVNGYQTVTTTTTSSPPATGLSGHIAEMFVRLNYDLSATARALLPRLFTILWQPVLRRINQLFYNKLVLENRFTPVGANQLHYDLYNCLRALLMPYANLLAVDDLLAECFDACRLLNLPPGSIHLLRQSLLATDISSVVLGPLVELGIRRLTPEDAMAAESESADFDTNALQDLAKEHQRRVRQKQADLETCELRVLNSVFDLASQVSINLNEKVSKAYENQCRLNTEVKRLCSNILTFSRQVDLWSKEIFEISSALKELGDAETWSQKLCRDVQIIHDTLEAADK
ncbi:unnamed protein product [Hydatigera taeniaeformis]|uniref:Biogenesis of lysosome-related organelles complex 1 subunit 1 n=1 Tax=Hydatigena taeniaeformis TaxID=6205 RepID=A0A158REN6_HYDTA|nr:unnamed protein product [Hydatigera taeniaeformis]